MACGNYTPAELGELANLSGLTIEEVESFIIKVFGSVPGYHEACADKTRLDDIMKKLNRRPEDGN